MKTCNGSTKKNEKKKKKKKNRGTCGNSYFSEMIPFSVQISQQCMREVKRAAIQSQKTTKDTPSRARRLTREMLVYWKRFEKVEKEHRKRVEKEAIEKRKLDLELSEVGYRWMVRKFANIFLKSLSALTP